MSLWKYAENHQGKFPPNEWDDSIPKKIWQTQDPSGLFYHYISGNKRDSGKSILAYEPGIYGAERLVLFSDGDISLMKISEIQQKLNPKKQ